MSARTFPPVGLSVVIPSWEIECCAPPPVVGRTSSWTLIFEPVATPDRQSLERTPGSVTELQWQVEPWADDATTRALYRNGFAAFYRPFHNTVDASTAPPLGRRVVRGVVFGTKHGGFVDDGFPNVSAPVGRIQVVSTEFRLQNRELVPVAGSTRLREVEQSPRWFASHPPRLVAVDPGPNGRRTSRSRRGKSPTVEVQRAETGVLLQLLDTGTGR